MTGDGNGPVRGVVFPSPAVAVLLEQTWGEIVEVTTPVDPRMAAFTLVVDILDAVLGEHGARWSDGLIQEVCFADGVVDELHRLSRFVERRAVLRFVIGDLLRILQPHAENT